MEYSGMSRHGDEVIWIWLSLILTSIVKVYVPSLVLAMYMYAYTSSVINRDKLMQYQLKCKITAISKSCLSTVKFKF